MVLEGNKAGKSQVCKAEGVSTPVWRNTVWVASLGFYQRVVCVDKSMLGTPSGCLTCHSGKHVWPKLWIYIAQVC
jgi:hypothetical protein